MSKLTVNTLRLGNTISTDPLQLDWYEEGTFTPTVVGETTAGVATYNQRSAHFTRIGKVLTFTMYLSWSAHTGTGNLLFGGLPYSSSADYGTLNVMADSLTFTGSYLAGYYRAASNAIEVFGCASAAAWVRVPMDTSASIFISGSMQLWGV